MDEPYLCVDVLVIGAGIQGAGVAQAAAAQGWSTCVIEKNASAGEETSSKSSKLIHGGLRYLETYQFSLVRKCLREKKRLCHIAPSLVKPARFIIPVYNNSQRSPLWVRIGLWLYALLGWPDNPVRGRLSRREWSAHAELNQQGLCVLFEYDDAQTDDKALTEAVLNSAEKLGANVLFNGDVERVSYSATQGYITQLRDGRRIVSQAFVNATGPWVNEFVQCMVPQPPVMAIDLVQGTHLVVNRPAMACCYYMESPDDGRALFVLPWKGKTLIGTTELMVREPSTKCEASADDVRYLIRAYNYFFPRHRIGSNDVIECFTGMRVLPRSSANENKRSRENALLTTASLPGYLAICGGKLTSYRMSAESVIAKLKPYLPVTQPIADTRVLKLDKAPNPDL
ncbi:glycerol-3-phosphate dehydrogenase/oxidase [Teredinibacter purpureus]|uniref:glycerol-3-phosphate dehydrogenase/oxidase n=1 Tax=Teredinibacter purpureus TaxID=2731756 RepID=UPI0005F859B7|nr:FAD-dependent oxidoreductase [Teredinibacter purpureus]